MASSLQPVTAVVPEHRLALSEVLDALVGDGLASRADADQLVSDRRMHRNEQHPLVLIADQKWKSRQPPNRVLSLEALAEWLAGKVGM